MARRKNVKPRTVSGIVDGKLRCIALREKGLVWELVRTDTGKDAHVTWCWSHTSAVVTARAKMLELGCRSLRWSPILRKAKKKD